MCVVCVSVLGYVHMSAGARGVQRQSQILWSWSSCELPSMDQLMSEALSCLSGPLHPTFPWVQGIQTQVFRFGCQVFYSLNHLPSPASLPFYLKITFIQPVVIAHTFNSSTKYKRIYKPISKTNPPAPCTPVNVHIFISWGFRGLGKVYLWYCLLYMWRMCMSEHDVRSWVSYRMCPGDLLPLITF